MTAVGQTGLDTKGFGRADKVRHGARIHLAHHLSTVNLDRDFAQIHLRGNLLVQQAGQHKGHHLFLMR
jgi:hypothetical protein